MVTPQKCELPLIDLSALSSECEADRRSCAEAIRMAATEWGAFQVVNHGIRSEPLGEMRREQVKLLETPFQTKASSGLLNNSYRWDTPTATYPAQCSCFESFHVPLIKTPDPSCYGQFISLTGVTMELTDPMSGLARMLAGVQLENRGHRGCRAFNEIRHESTCFLWLNHHPVCPLPPERFRLVPHADSDFLTILRQDQLGDVQLLKDSRWVAVKPNRDALIVNIGDLLQAWSNDQYRSVERKVTTNGEVERYSVAHSLCPSYDSRIGSCGEPSIYRKFTSESSPRGVVLNKNERPVPRHKEKEKYYAGISMELVLYEDPWKIRKKLTESDLNGSSRLMLPGNSVKDHVLPWMGKKMVELVNSREGAKVMVRRVESGDMNAGVEHQLTFRRYRSSGSYVLNGGWIELFVKGRGLKVGDEIGMYWDTVSHKFHFKVLCHAAT